MASPLEKLPIPKIPIFTTPDEPLVGTTQEHLPFSAIEDNILLFKDGGAALVLESTSLNFGLLSEREQEAVVAAYAALINSFSFTVQIVIRTQRKDITYYLHYLDEAYNKIENEKLKGLMNSYRNFVIETTKKRNVLGKRFFLVVPFSPLELGVSKSLQTLTKRTVTLPYTKEYVKRKALIALEPKRDHLTRQAARLGLRLKQLDTAQLTDLFYQIYNPKIETVKAKNELDPQDSNNTQQ